jgi:hypothetical protein
MKTSFWVIMLPDVWQQSGFYKCWKEHLLNWTVTCFIRKIEISPTSKSFWNEAIGSYRETTLWISRSHSIDTSRHSFKSPRNIFSRFGATGIHTDFPNVLPRHYLHQTMKPENSLPCSEQPALGPNPEQHKSSMRHSILCFIFKIFTNIIVLSMPTSFP